MGRIILISESYVLENVSNEYVSTEEENDDNDDAVYVDCLNEMEIQGACDEILEASSDSVDSEEGSRSSESDTEDSDHMSESSSNSNDSDSFDAHSDDDINNYGDERLYDGAPLSICESILAILSLVLRHSLSGSCLADILDLVYIHCPQPNMCTKTSYLFKKYFRNIGSIPPVRHYFCSSCFSKLTDQNAQCPENITHTNVSYFIEIPLLSQLEKMFKRDGFYDSLNHRFTRTKKNPNNYEDIYDGEIYKQLSRENNILSNPSNISLTWNTDGVSIFKSSKYCIWPFYFMINELPHYLRSKMQNVLLGGLWFGSSQPQPNLFMKYSLVDSLKKLYEGVGFKIFGRANLVRVKGIVICGTCDLPAKSKFLNMKQFNGNYGCQKCKDKGRRISPRVLVYPYKNINHIRTSEETTTLAKQAHRTGLPMIGVKGPTCLSQFAYDYIRTTVVDAMHCIFLGVTKKVISLLFDSKYRDSDYSLCRYTDLVNTRMCSIHPPSSVERLPRKISEYTYWKASEFKIWLLYYSVPILCDIMKPEYFEHYKLLVLGVSLLYQDSISEQMMQRAKEALRLYVERFEGLYGLRHMTCNLHLLLHLSDVVKDFGPLWVTSCFPFENLNGLFKNLVHGTKYASLQICAGISYIVHYAMLKNDILIADTPVKKFCDRLDGKGKFRRKTYLVSDKIRIVGKYTHLTAIPGEMVTVLDIAEQNDLNLHRFDRLLMDGILYTSDSYHRFIKTNSSCIRYVVNNRSHIGIVKWFLRVSNCPCQKLCEQCNINCKMYAAVMKCKINNIFSTQVQGSNTSLFIYDCKKLINEILIVVEIKYLRDVCFHVEIKDQNLSNFYVSIPVNTLRNE